MRAIYAAPMMLLPLVIASGCASAWKKPVDAGAPDIADVEGYRETQGDENKGLFSGLNRGKLSTRVKTAVGKGPDRDVARASFARGDELYREAAATREKPGERNRLFLKAAEKYAEAADRWPNSSMEENALFMAGDSLFFADHYDDANEKFEELLKKFPNSRHLDRAEARRFSIAHYWEQQNERRPEPFYYMNFTNEARPFHDVEGHALRIYDKIRIDDPTGELADDATMAAANMHFKQGKYIVADEYYSDLRKAFPNSEHQFMAHFLGLRAKLASYQGVDYSGTVLVQAKELIKTMRTQFPRESQEKAEILAKAEAEANYLLAERDWKDGQYYDRRNEFGAAKFHYAKLIKEYPGTPFAQQAQTRVGQIHGLPEAPDQKLEWLVNLFPGREEPRLQALPADGPESMGTEAIAQGQPAGSQSR
ncbi:MAG: outer membrane protein assembly factor BamD [Planctomycetales bacterium]|nr:outer membrane protein assembly factor BamD [Planctomycetales bacterium]